MLRLSRLLWAEVTTINSSTASAGGRLIRIRKKAKWIDRRSTRIPHGGKDIYYYGDHPSCALCRVRFRYKQDYEAHKESELHRERLRWAETAQWWADTGAAAHRAEQQRQWEWFERAVLPARAQEEGVPLEAARRAMRQAQMRETPEWHLPLQPPTARREVKEPRDQRWPASPKW